VPQWLRSIAAVGLACAAACQDRPADGTVRPEADPPATRAADAKPAAQTEGEPTATSPTWAVAVKQLKSPLTRAATLSKLTAKLTAENKRGDQTQRPSFAAEVIPVLASSYTKARADRDAILRLATAAGPSGAAVFDKALELDGTKPTQDRAERALEAIVQTRAVASTPAMLAMLAELLADSTHDGDARVRMRLVEALGTVGDRRATTQLIDVLMQPIDKQPVAVHRAAASALGTIRDPAAVDALITTPFRIPDVPTTTSVSERSKAALASIGDAAVPGLVEALQGKHADLNRLAADNGVPPAAVTMTAAHALGAVGSRAAVPALVAAMPVDDCSTAAADPDAIMLRAVIATALGQIGSADAVPALCPCARATHDPSDTYPLAEALGRIGGADAVTCLAHIITHGRFDEDSVANPKFVHEIRWEAARFGVMAADETTIGVVRKAIARASRKPTVAAHMGDANEAIAVVDRCLADVACYRAVLEDAAQTPFAREKAAVELARRSPDDLAVAKSIASTYGMRDPDARVTIALLPGMMLGSGKARCPGCASELQRVLDAESTARIDARYQLSVLTARIAIAKLRD